MSGEEAEAFEQALHAGGLPSDWRFRVTLSRRRRTGVTMDIGHDGAIEVIAPAAATPEEVVELVRSQQGDLARVLADAAGRDLANQRKELVDGEAFILLDQGYELRLVDGGAPAQIEREDHALGHVEVLAVRRGRPADMRAAIVALYKQEGLAWARRHAEPYLTQAGAPELVVDDVGRTGRWGAYLPGEHRIRLDWVIAGLPRPLREYVLIHELAHAATRYLRPAHGPRWERQMTRWMVDWRQRSAMLNAAQVETWKGEWK